MVCAAQTDRVANARLRSYGIPPPASSFVHLLPRGEGRELRFPPGGCRPGRWPNPLPGGAPLGGVRTADVRWVRRSSRGRCKNPPSAAGRPATAGIREKRRRTKSTPQVHLGLPDGGLVSGVKTTSANVLRVYTPVAQDANCKSVVELLDHLRREVSPKILVACAT